MIRTIPYISQSASPELAEAFFTKNEDPKNDTNWKISGAESLEEYCLWVKHICGIACLAMILKAKGYKNIRLINLAKEAERYGAYRIQNTNIEGLFYRPFTKYVKELFNINSEVIKRNLNTKQIIKRLHNMEYIIASVSPQIRYANQNNMLVPNTRGGHLIVITGIDNEYIYYHDPAGIYNESQENASIPLSRFNHFFAGRGIAIKD